MKSRRRGDFLGLTDDETSIVELKVGARQCRQRAEDSTKVDRGAIGCLLGSSQSRIAKMEAADPSASIDLTVRSLLRMGASRKEVASYISPPRRRHPQ